MMQTIVYVRRYVQLIFIAFLFAVPGRVKAQDVFKDFANLFTVPANYVVKHVNQPPVIDGNIDDTVWQQATWTKDFEDIEGDLKPKPRLQTNVKMLWDDTCLYIAAQIHDPQVWATLKKHDEVVFYDNDFEVFINPSNTTHNYYEVEVNALNTIFDLYLPKPYHNSGDAVTDWDARGMRTAVNVQGTLNNATDTDKGWTVEMAIPFKALSGSNRRMVPHDGSLWRINFSRVEYDTEVKAGKSVKVKDPAGRNLPEHNWVWSSQGVVNMHFPERWGYLLFNKDSDTTFVMPYTELQKKYLWLIYYKQKEWYKTHLEYITTFEGLKLPADVNVSGNKNTLRLEATKHQFIAYITDEKSKITCMINQDGLVEQQINPKTP